MNELEQLTEPMGQPLVGFVGGRAGVQTIQDPRFQVLEKLGEGGAGLVYRAFDFERRQHVALKLLAPRLCSQDDARLRFRREVDAGSFLRHRHIARTYELLVMDGGQPVIVMEFCEGETLEQKLRRGALGVEEAIDVALMTASGLAHAHHKGIVHRDIKPANLMITKAGEVKIIDFGLARLRDASPQLTECASTVGTVAYMSPEQTRGALTDCRIDIWSLGVVLYEMVSGRHPFRRDNPHATIYSLRHDNPAPLGGQVPARLEGLILKTLSKEPADRPQSAADVALVLRALKHSR